MPHTTKKPRTLRLSSVALLAAVGATWLVSACGSDKKGAAQLAKLTEPCSLNSDCNSPLVCAFQRCHAACNATRDCPNPARCVKGTDTMNVCQFPTERSCHEDSECSGKEKCAEDKECRDPCQAASECTKGQVCSSSGACAEPSECLMTPVAADPGSCTLPVRSEPVADGGGSSSGGDSGVGGNHSGGSTGNGGGTGGTPGGAGETGNGGEAGATLLDADGCPPDMKNCDRSDPDCETPVNTITGCGSCTVTCESVHGSVACENLKCVVPAGMCETNYGDCDSDGKNGCESALLTDADNCGTCGRVCEGGTPCTNGSCASATVVTLVDNLVDYPVFTKDKIFLLSASGLSFVDRNSTTLPATATFKASSASVSLTGDADFVYWIRRTAPITLRKFSTAGTGEVIAVNEDLGGVNQWAVLRSNATALFMSTYYIGPPFNIATLAKGAATKPASIVDNTNSITSLVASNSHLAWVDNAPSVKVSPVAGGVGTAITTVDTAALSTSQLRVSGEYAYWNVDGTNTAKIRRFNMNAANGAAETIAFDLPSAVSLAVDDQYVYYLVNTSDLYRVVQDGSHLQELVNRNTGMDWISYVDDKYVWGGKGATLLRTPK